MNFIVVAHRDVKFRDQVSVSRLFETKFSWSRSRSRGPRSRSRSRGVRSRCRSGLGLDLGLVGPGLGLGLVGPGLVNIPAFQELPTKIT